MNRWALFLAFDFLSLGLFLVYLGETLWRYYPNGPLECNTLFCTKAPFEPNWAAIFIGIMLIIFSGFGFLYASLAPSDSSSEKQLNTRTEIV